MPRYSNDLSQASRRRTEASPTLCPPNCFCGGKEVTTGSGDFTAHYSRCLRAKLAKKGRLPLCFLAVLALSTMLGVHLGVRVACARFVPPRACSPCYQRQTCFGVRAACCRFRPNARLEGLASKSTYPQTLPLGRMREGQGARGPRALLVIAHYVSLLSC